MAGPIYLLGSGHGGLPAKLAARAVGDTGKRKPRVAVTVAPMAGDDHGMKYTTGQMPRLFPGTTLDVIENDRSVVDGADLIFVSGGDPVHGAKALARTGAADWIREASARGAVVMGISAGAILLGDWWADWPEDDSSTEPVPLVACLGIAAGHVFDTHDEADDWAELRTVAKSLESRAMKATFIGIPSGGALVGRGGEPFEVVGSAPFTLR
jgi:putative intracellular protease/amidase